MDSGSGRDSPLSLEVCLPAPLVWAPPSWTKPGSPPVKGAASGGFLRIVAEQDGKRTSERCWNHQADIENKNSMHLPTVTSNNVLLVKIEGPVWHTIYHHFPVVKGVSPNPSINQPTNGKRTSMVTSDRVSKPVQRNFRTKPQVISPWFTIHQSSWIIPRLQFTVAQFWSLSESPFWSKL